EGNLQNQADNAGYRAANGKKGQPGQYKGNEQAHGLSISMVQGRYSNRYSLKRSDGYSLFVRFVPSNSPHSTLGFGLHGWPVLPVGFVGGQYAGIVFLGAARLLASFGQPIILGWHTRRRRLGVCI